MKTIAAFFRSRVVVVAGALLTTLLAGGCITHPPGGKPQAVDTSKETKPTGHRRKSDITHPPGGSNDVSKDRPVRVRSSAPPTTITHPGG